MEQRKEKMWVSVMESNGDRLVFPSGDRSPEGITLAGPNPVPHDFDFGEHLTEALET